MSTRSPVLFLVFNRPDTTQRVFDAIRAARPPRLYVAADGPRAGRAGEAARCEAVRRIATAVDWPCELVTLMRPTNLGCKRAVSSAITWFFEREPEGIILEDDCLPDPSFFGYCDELLERFRDDERIMCISGDNFISGSWQPDASYYFSRFNHIWGWASWRRAWQRYDVDMRAWNPVEAAMLLGQVFPRDRLARIYWREAFDRVTKGEIDTWDYQWTFACWREAAVTCLPRVNLISNLGFGTDATHTVTAENTLANLPTEAIQLPLVHPQLIEITEQADRWTIKYVFGIHHVHFVRRWLANVPFLGRGLRALHRLTVNA